MATATDIVTRALRRLSVLQPGGTASAAMLTHGLDELNDMLDGFTAKGVNIDPTLPLPAEHRPGLIAMLAQRLASSYGAASTFSQLLAKEAADGWFSLQAAYIFAPNASFDTALQQMPSQRRIGSTGSLAQFLNGSLTVPPSAAPSLTGFCTLAVGAPTTLVTNSSCLLSSTITLTPYSQAAQAEWNTVTPIVAAGPLTGQFTITHQNNQIPDRIFEYLLVI